MIRAFARLTRRFLPQLASKTFGRETAAIDTNLLLKILWAKRLDAAITAPPIEEGRAALEAIRSRGMQVIVVQSVLFECVNVFLEAARMRYQVDEGYQVRPQGREWPEAEREAFNTSWRTGGGANAIGLLQTLQEDDGLQFQDYPSTDDQSLDWLVVQQVFLRAHEAQGAWFHLSDLVVASQVIASRADEFVTRDGPLRTGLEKLRQDAAFKASLIEVDPSLTLPRVRKSV
jgi:hypothetical protein